MDIRVQRLRETMELLGPVVPKKPTIASLAGVLLKDGTAMATDLEVAVSVELPEADGACLMPYRPVADLLKHVPGDKTLAVKQEGMQVHLAWPGGRASYETHDPQDYPPLPPR